MDIYVINLEKEKYRKNYMINLLNEIGFKHNVHFIKAIEGCALEEKELKKMFDFIRHDNSYLWRITKEEIGCVLSHRKCYESFLESNKNTALILEDDVCFITDIRPYLSFAEKFLNTDIPRILLFSGWFWYTSSKKHDGNRRLCKIWDARLAHAYVINKTAASIILNKRPWYLADHWNKIFKLGIEIYGLSPHLTTTNRDPRFKSAIQVGRPGIYNYSLRKWLTEKRCSLIRKSLKFMKNFEQA